MTQFHTIRVHYRQKGADYTFQVPDDRYMLKGLSYRSLVETEPVPHVLSGFYPAKSINLKPLDYRPNSNPKDMLCCA
jgi:hypothetical protein